MMDLSNHDENICRGVDQYTKCNDCHYLFCLLDRVTRFYRCKGCGTGPIRNHETMQMHIEKVHNGLPRRRPICPHCNSDFATLLHLEKHKKEEYKETENFLTAKKFLSDEFYKCDECPYEHCMRNGASQPKQRLVFGQGFN